MPVRSDKRWNYRFHRRPVASSGRREVFAVRLLSDRKLLKNISFSVNKARLSAWPGSQVPAKTSWSSAFVGSRPCTGQILIGGRARSIRSPENLLRNGVAIAPSDRRTAGAIQVTVLHRAPAAAIPKDAFRSIDLLTPNETELRILLGLEPDHRFIREIDLLSS